MSSLAHHMDTKITHLFCFHPYGNSLHCIICLPLHNISACYLHTTCFTHSVNRHIFVYEIPLPFKNIYSPIPPTRHKGIFLTKIMPVFQEKKKLQRTNLMPICWFSVLTAPLPLQELYSSPPTSERF